MPISPVITNCVEVRLLWVINAQGAMNILHGSVGSGFTASQAIANTLGAAIKAAFTSNLQALCTVNTSLVRVGVRDLRTANQAEFLDTGAIVSGSAVGDAMPAQIAQCLTLRTAQAGKSFRGRVYLGGFAESTNDTNGIQSTAASTAGVAFLTAVSNAMTASQITFGVASRPAERYTIVKTTFHNDGTSTARTIEQGAARAGGVQNVNLIQSRDARWETQRRRMNGRGAAPSLLTAVAQQELHP